MQTGIPRFKPEDFEFTSNAHNFDFPGFSSDPPVVPENPDDYYADDIFMKMYEDAERYQQLTSQENSQKELQDHNTQQVIIIITTSTT